MRLLYVIHYPFFGGPQNQALRLASPLVARGIETTVVLPEEPGNAAERLRDAGVDVVQLPLHRLRARPDPRVQVPFLARFPYEIWALRRLMRERRSDVVQVGGLVNPHAAIAARLENRAVVWQLLDTRPPMALRRALMPFVVRLADVVMTTGRGVAAVHPGAAGLGRRLVPFFPPVDTHEFRPDAARRELARAELGIAPHEWLVGTVANLTPQKGLDGFVRVADRLATSGENIQFRIIGSAMETQASYAGELRRMISASTAGSDGRLAIVDPGTRVVDLLPALDLFLLTSVPRSEGISTTVLEAMATGIPVIASNVGAIGEAIAEGRTGVLVPPLDDEGMAEATAALLADGERRANMGRAARERAERLFDVEACADVHAAAYRRAVEHRELDRDRRRGARP